MNAEQQSIEESNAALAAATRPEKCVLLAQDALLWLELGALKANNGVYVQTMDRGIYDRVANSPFADGQARDVVLGPCFVCGLGALLIAKAVRYDGVTLRDLTRGSSVVYARLNDIFDTPQLHAIECAFEADHLDAWYEFYPEPQDRLAAILQNIIRNKGTFISTEVQAP